MKILIAEDDEASRRILRLTLTEAGHEVVSARDGAAAWAILESEDAPALAILDWMMPGMDGLEVCRLARRRDAANPVYIILLTAKADKADVVQGLAAGANDYILKPFNANELDVRVQVGESVINLQRSLSERVEEFQNALAKVRLLEELIPVCPHCNDIRNDQFYWQQLNTYIGKNKLAHLVHGTCPACYESVIKTRLEEQAKKRVVK